MSREFGESPFSRFPTKSHVIGASVITREAQSVTVTATVTVIMYNRDIRYGHRHVSLITGLNTLR